MIRLGQGRKTVGRLVVLAVYGQPGWLNQDPSFGFKGVLSNCAVDASLASNHNSNPGKVDGLNEEVKSLAKPLTAWLEPFFLKVTVTAAFALATTLNGDQGTAHFLGEKGFVKDFRLVEGNQLVMGAVKMEKWRVIGAYVSEG